MVEGAKVESVMAVPLTVPLETIAVVAAAVDEVLARGVVPQAAAASERDKGRMTSGESEARHDTTTSGYNDSRSGSQLARAGDRPYSLLAKN